MTTSNERAISELNNLIEICKDGQKGFQRAAADVKDSELKALFTRYSNQRAQYASEMQNQVVLLGGQPEASGTAAGAVHRGWIDVKSAITGRDDHAILEECERGEDAAKNAYQKALEGAGIPGTVLPLIEKQYEEVQEAHDRVRMLRDSFVTR